MYVFIGECKHSGKKVICSSEQWLHKRIESLLSTHTPKKWEESIKKDTNECYDIKHTREVEEMVCSFNALKNRKKYVREIWMRNLHMCVSHIIIFHWNIHAFTVAAFLFLQLPLQPSSQCSLFFSPSLSSFLWYICSISFYRQLNPFSVASQMRTLWFMIFFYWIELL